jgi:hypothetical protein
MDARLTRPPSLVHFPGWEGDEADFGCQNENQLETDPSAKSAFLVTFPRVFVRNPNVVSMLLLALNQPPQDYPGLAIPKIRSSPMPMLEQQVCFTRGAG